MPPTIAPATSADLPQILELLERCRLPTVGLAEHLDTTLVAQDGDRVVGSAALELYGAAALLRSVAVAPGLRGLGHGEELTRRALELARRRRIRTVYLLTETAGGFFPRFGFRTVPRNEVDRAVQRSVEFTRACPASAQVMEKVLGPGG
jgi:amino-acid N-acetyltransferase